MGSIEEAARFAKIAVEFDRNGNIPEAIRHYYYATNLLDSIVFKSSDSADSIKAKSQEYRKRAAQLGEDTCYALPVVPKLYFIMCFTPCHETSSSCLHAEARRPSL